MPCKVGDDEDEYVAFRQTPPSSGRRERGGVALRAG
jgi:hypothetical protein